MAKKSRKSVLASNDNYPGRRVGRGGSVLSHAGKYSKTGAAIQPPGGTIKLVGHDGPFIGRPSNKPVRSKTWGREFK